ncbi:MAG TPA: response regulator [Methylococcaceae bacterium]|nr:response regulator [Methylococcaceae bacterium]HIN69468.1 response regulator [Methylococcales bacterium]HIA45057.1 response regulator [Methylococcaceae bacterium]HIB61924.1 response regulator [Methylococcaceae bacterium]HIO11994.1 response regulator [Methylococcales bacterium]
MIKVLIVDDQELIRLGVKSLLEAASSLEVTCYLASSGEEALAQHKELSPDIIFLDVNMPGIGGVETARKILQAATATKVIVLSVLDDGPIPAHLVQMGVSGFICKDTGVGQLVVAIQTVLAGDFYLSDKVAQNIALKNLGVIGGNPFSLLSNREASVLHLTLQGHAIKTIAELLKVTEKTVVTYRYRVFKKLDVHNDIELMHLAIKYNYTDWKAGA